MNNIKCEQAIDSVDEYVYAVNCQIAFSRPNQPLVKFQYCSRAWAPNRFLIRQDNLDLVFLRARMFRLLDIVETTMVHARIDITEMCRFRRNIAAGLWERVDESWSPVVCAMRQIHEEQFAAT